jgi:hypothetical protein
VRSASSLRVLLYAFWSRRSRLASHLARIIHQPEKLTREGPGGGQLILSTTVVQDHHAPKASASAGLDSVRSGLSVVSRRTSSEPPPWADNSRFRLEPPEVACAHRAYGLRRLDPYNVQQRRNTGATGHDEGNAIRIRSLPSCTRAPSLRRRNGLVAIVAQAHGVVLHTSRRRVSRST